MFNIFRQTLAISPQDAASRIGGASVRFIDVRSEAEYRSGHAKGAEHIALEAISDHAKELVHAQEVYAICASGGRSGRAVETLRTLGVNAINVSGGTLAWRSAGLPME